MKWGRRKAQVSAAGHKVLAGIYGLNEKTYKNSNKTLSSMNAAAKKTQLAKAEKASKSAAEQKKKIDAAVSTKRQANKAKRNAPINSFQEYKKEQTKTKAMRWVGVGAKSASRAMTTIGKIGYEMCKNNATSGQVAALRVLGYGAKALNVAGTAAIAGSYAKQYNDYKRYTKG